MSAIVTQRQWLHPEGERRVERGIEMRKQGAATRNFVTQCLAETIFIEGDEEQSVLSLEVLGGGFDNLPAGGEMDEPVGQIDRRAVKDAFVDGLLPQIFRADLVDCAHEGAIGKIGALGKMVRTGIAPILDRLPPYVRATLMEIADMTANVTSCFIWSAPALLAFALSTAPSLAQEQRYQLEKTPNGYVRMDSSSGEMSICEERGAQLVCRVAADERTALQDEVDRLREDLANLQKRVDRIEGNPAGKTSSGLPSEEEFEKSLSYMERFFRSFMGIVKEQEREEQRTPAPNRS